ncbi:unnamed protein product [Mycena citricolor]|uniref:Chromatin remodeling complex protein n=1 Tax=Mycena citricolor TaxID=2018698 RepID=A0AAD2GWA8_9AGAR|nr:unnamed protein product [Mycena citricolor]CAK5280104.1 unnamed protein product [Mycena citricolor]
MPTCRRKKVVLTEPSPALLEVVKTNPTKDVFFLQQTGEIFETYEAYAARMSFYRQKQFQCDVTGKSGLDYFQAVQSEMQEARTLHSRFPEALKGSVLKAVQWQVVGRLDHLVEAVYERFKDRYFPCEKVLVDLAGVKYHAEIRKVFPPKYNDKPDAREAFKSGQGCSSSEPIAVDEPPHAIVGDLKEPAKEANARDDPALYYYWVHLFEPEKDSKQKAAAKNAEQDPSAVDSLREVQCGALSRDRLAFSKSILRRFIRDCVDRDPAVASPWTVKTLVAQRFGVEYHMPEQTKKNVETVKKGESDKRKKVWDDKEQPPTKRQKKLTAAQEEKAAKRERENAEKAEKQKAAKEEAERLAAEKKKRKPIRYPTEDLDVRITDKEKKAGVKVKRPVPNRIALPFNDSPGTFESFLMAWNFLVVFGQALNLSPITLDEFEHGIQHTVAEAPCPMLGEIHASLVYNLRTVPFIRHSALLSLLGHNRETGMDEIVFGISLDELTAAMAEVGNNWERVPLRHSDNRSGWEDALFGCLKDHATLTNFPTIRQVLTRLLFAPDPSSEACPSLLTPTLQVVSSPAERYHSLPAADRIAILSFMANLATSSKAVHGHLELCEEQLTALRKEKIEVNRLKKQYAEEMNVLRAEMKENGADVPEPEVVLPDSSDLSDVPGEEPAPKKMKPTKRDTARAKQASLKQATADHRRLDEEINKLERRLEGIERDFRKLLSTVRVRPLGKDRFFNRVWWFDGIGSGSLVNNGGVSQYGAGRVFIQGPSELDLELLKNRTEDNVEERRKEEEGIEGMLGPSDWAVFSDQEELDEFMAWLNSKGNREVALKGSLTKWWPHILSGVKRRMADINASARLPEARRSTRAKAASGYDVSREPYMLWTNRKATSAPAP